MLLFRVGCILSRGAKNEAEESGEVGRLRFTTVDIGGNHAQLNEDYSGAEIKPSRRFVVRECKYTMMILKKIIKNPFANSSFFERSRILANQFALHYGRIKIMDINAIVFLMHFLKSTEKTKLIRI